MSGNVRFVSGNVRFMSGNVRYVARNVRFVSVRVVTELAKYRLGSVGVQKVSSDKGGTAQCFCREVNYCKLRNTPAGKKVEFASDKISHVVLTGHW
jgi:hypothetical protein